MVGTPEEIFAQLKEYYGNKPVSIIIWTMDDVASVADQQGMELTENEIIEVMHDLSANEEHEYGVNELSVAGYCSAILENR